MKILITGVAGLLGSRLTDYIIENYPDVVVVGIDNLSGGYKENVNPNVEFWQMNLVEQPIENCFAIHKFDYVYHFATYAAEGYCNLLHNWVDNQYLSLVSSPKNGNIDIGNFMTRSKFSKQLQLDVTKGDADGLFVEEYLEKFKGSIIHVNKFLYVHN